MTILTIMEIVGPLVLAAAFIYGLLVASRRPRTKRTASDAATRRMYEQKDP